MDKGPSAETLAALETAPNMYLVLSPDLYILTASDLYLEATQTTRAAIAGKHIFEAFPENPAPPRCGRRAEYQCFFTNRTAHQKAGPHESPALRCSGYDQPRRVYPALLGPSHTPVLDDDGNILYIIQLATNVTDKILAEQALVKSYKEQLETTEQVPALNNELLAANTELRETQQQLSLLNRQLEERVVQRTQLLANANEEQAAINEEIAAANGELTTIRQYLERSNRELAASSARLRMAVESTGLGTWEYSPVTGTLSWSRECYKIFGIPEDHELSFDTYVRHIHPDDREYVTAKVDASLEQPVRSDAPHHPRR